MLAPLISLLALAAPPQTAGVFDKTPATTTPPPQGPLEMLGQWVNRLLLERLHISPALLGVIHLLLAIAATIMLAWASGALCQWLGKRLGRRGHLMPARLLKLSAVSLRWVVLLAGLADAISDVVTESSHERWQAVRNPARWLSGILFVLAVIIGTRAAVRLGRVLIEGALQPALTQTVRANDSLPPVASLHALPLVQRMVALVLWLCGLILVLDHFGQNVSSVVAALGVTSLAIGLASQQALSNMIAGLVLILDRPFRIGDRIRLGTDSGVVLEMGMRSTQIQLADGTLLIVPNADLVNSRLVNHSTDDAVRGEVRVTVPALLDVEHLSADLLAAAAAADPPILQKPAPRVQLLTIADKLELALIFWLPRQSEVPVSEEKLRRAALASVQTLLQTMASTASAAAAAASAAAAAAAAAPATPASGPAAAAPATPASGPAAAAPATPSSGPGAAPR